MSKVHVVKVGDGISSIAFKNGHFPKTIWGHPENAPLREIRTDPDCLAAGDKVVVPSISPSTVSVPTDKRHVFRRKGVPTFFTLQLLGEHREKLVDVSYRLSLGGKWFSDWTDSTGRLGHWVPPSAGKGELLLDFEGPQGIVTQKIEVRVGQLAPINTIRGCLARLNNLSYEPGDTWEEEKTILAIKSMQRDVGLIESGRMDSETHQALFKLYGR
jgi:hypothetical protein